MGWGEIVAPVGPACACEQCAAATAAYLAARGGRPTVLPEPDTEPTTGAPGAPPPWQARPLPTGYWQRLWAALRGR
jgi:hypothetical protein